MSLLLLLAAGGGAPGDVTFATVAAVVAITAGETDLVAPVLSSPEAAEISVSAPDGARLGIRSVLGLDDDDPNVTAVVVDRDGSNPDPFDVFTVDTVVKELGVRDEVTGSFPKHHPDAALFATLNREIQIYRKGDLVAWVVPLHPTASSHDEDVSVELPGADWHFSRLAIDRPLTSRLKNGDFEAGLDHWTPEGPITPTITAASKKFGTQSVELEASGDSVDAHIGQQFVEVGTGVGTLMIFVGWFQVVEWDGPALEARGLYIEGWDGSGLRDAGVFPIDDAVAEVGGWQRARTTLWVPPGEAWLIDPRPQAVNGRIRWDGLRILTMESLSTAQAGNVDAEEDLAVFAGKAARFVQAPANGKVALFIGTDTPPCGVTAARHVQFASHTFADSLLAEGADRGAYESWLAITPTTKTLTIRPTKGADKSDEILFVYGAPPAPTADVDDVVTGGILAYSYDEDGAGAETDATTHGEGDEADREEGHAQDLSEIDVVLQGVHAAPSGIDPAALQPMAERIVDLGHAVPKIPEITVAGDFLHLVETGDLVTVTIDDGWVQVPEEIVRVRRMEYARSADTLKLSLDHVGYRHTSGMDRVVRRLEQLERPARSVRSVVREEVLRFSAPGIIVVDDARSGPEKATWGGYLTKVVVAATAAPTGDVDVEVFVNGATIGVVTLPAGANESPPTYLGRHFLRADLDTVTVQRVAAPASGSDLVTRVYVRRIERT